MQYKHFFSLCCLVVYIFFSQFAIKAIATTNLSDYSSDDFCVSKRLDTLDAKQDCREKNNTAVSVEHIDVALESHILDLYVDIEYSARIVASIYISDEAYNAHAPPWSETISSSIYAHDYVGIVLQLL